VVVACSILTGSAAAQDAPLPDRGSPALFRPSVPNLAEEVRRQMRSLRRCYELEVHRGGDASPGALHFTIERSGRTGKIRFVPTGRRAVSSRFTGCLAAGVRRMRFSAQTGPVRVAYPLFVDVLY